MLHRVIPVAKQVVDPHPCFICCMPVRNFDVLCFWRMTMALSAVSRGRRHRAQVEAIAEQVLQKNPQGTSC